MNDGIVAITYLKIKPKTRYSVEFFTISILYLAALMRSGNVGTATGRLKNTPVLSFSKGIRPSETLATFRLLIVTAICKSECALTPVLVRYRRIAPARQPVRTSLTVAPGKNRKIYSGCWSSVTTGGNLRDGVKTYQSYFCIFWCPPNWLVLSKRLWFAQSGLCDAGTDFRWWKRISKVKPTGL